MERVERGEQLRGLRLQDLRDEKQRDLENWK